MEDLQTQVQLDCIVFTVDDVEMTFTDFDAVIEAYTNGQIDDETYNQVFQNYYDLVSSN